MPRVVIWNAEMSASHPRAHLFAACALAGLTGCYAACSPDASLVGPDVVVPWPTWFCVGAAAWLHWLGAKGAPPRRLLTVMATAGLGLGLGCGWPGNVHVALIQWLSTLHPFAPAVLGLFGAQPVFLSLAAVLFHHRHDALWTVAVPQLAFGAAVALFRQSRRRAPRA